jgi:hypothetical protein
MQQKAELLRSIISAHKNDPDTLNKELDKMLNTTKIAYKSKADYEQNFPAEGDVNAKVKIIMERLKQ